MEKAQEKYMKHDKTRKKRRIHRQEPKNTKIMAKGGNTTKTPEIHATGRNGEKEREQ